MSPQSLKVSQVRLEALPPANSGELSELFIRHCAFCCKKCYSTEENRDLLERMSGEDGFFCSFCIREGFHTKNRKDVLILSFRALVGWLYYFRYLTQQSGRIWITELEDFIKSHQRVGLTNPAFCYDADTMLWFINFALIGDGKKRQGIEEVYKTIINILACFNLPILLPDLTTSLLFDKYRKSVEEFYQKRQRPKNRYMLIPTLSGCGLNSSYHEGRISASKLRNFDVSLIES
jgi:hypothetical protein